MALTRHQELSLVRNEQKTMARADFAVPRQPTGRRRPTNTPVQNWMLNLPPSFQ